MKNAAILGILGMAGLFLVTGCATKAQDVVGTKIRPLKFNSYSCPQLAKEATRVALNVSQLTVQQDARAKKDEAYMTGAILVVPVLLVKGDDSVTERLSEAKGDLEAIEIASIRKDCGIEFRRR